MGKSAVQWKFETLESGRTRREPLVQSCSEIPQKKSVCLRSQFILNQGTGLQIKKKLVLSSAAGDCDSPLQLAIMTIEWVNQIYHILIGGGSSD